MREQLGQLRRRPGGHDVHEHVLVGLALDVGIELRALGIVERLLGGRDPLADFRVVPVGAVGLRADEVGHERDLLVGVGDVRGPAFHRGLIVAAGDGAVEVGELDRPERHVDADLGQLLLDDRGHVEVRREVARGRDLEVEAIGDR